MQIQGGVLAAGLHLKRVVDIVLKVQGAAVRVVHTVLVQQRAV